MTGIEKTDVINREISLCGYFVIVTSAKMTAEDALLLYKSRDASEKTFRGDKSYLGAHCERVYSNESIDTKIFIGFVSHAIGPRYLLVGQTHIGACAQQACRSIGFKPLWSFIGDAESR